MNIIEQVWGYMKGELAKNKPETIDALKRRIKRTWESIDPNSIQKQAEGMKKRLKLIIQSRGEMTEN